MRGGPLFSSKACIAWTASNNPLSKSYESGIGASFMVSLEERESITTPPAREVSEEIKCHVAITGSILDFVGDRVHG
uniref:Uridine-cytidine kinase C-like isoform X2 n=1 Tax=Rhizophora mucronata TaxID=61149 RepID=A0A2P2JN73_RHIMU